MKEMIGFGLLSSDFGEGSKKQFYSGLEAVRKWGVLIHHDRGMEEAQVVTGEGVATPHFSQAMRTLAWILWFGRMLLFFM